MYFVLALAVATSVGRVAEAGPGFFETHEIAEEASIHAFPMIEAYKVPFKFTGKIAKVTIDLKEVKAADRDEAKQARNVATLKNARRLTIKKGIWT